MRSVRNIPARLLAPAAAVLLPAAAHAQEALPPPELSVRGMVLHADLVVQAVMAGLLLASVLTWTVLGAKATELAAARRAARRAAAGADADRTLAARHARLPDERGAAALFAAAALAEMRLSGGAPAAGTRSRIASRLREAETGLARRAARGTGVLATIGSTAPFVGLFGTVWGIMTSFMGIARSHASSLAVVAPGIAEALLATACGLVAAIPAVVIYNALARATAGYRAELAALAAAIERLASRELDLDPAGAASNGAPAAAPGEAPHGAPGSTPGSAPGNPPGGPEADPRAAHAAAARAA